MKRFATTEWNYDHFWSRRAKSAVMQKTFKPKTKVLYTSIVEGVMLEVARSW